MELGDEDVIVLVQSECFKLVMGATMKSHMLPLRNHGAWPGREEGLVLTTWGRRSHSIGFPSLDSEASLLSKSPWLLSTPIMPTPHKDSPQYTDM